MDESSYYPCLFIFDCRVATPIASSSAPSTSTLPAAPHSPVQGSMEGNLSSLPLISPIPLGVPPTNTPNAPQESAVGSDMSITDSDKEADVDKAVDAPPSARTQDIPALNVGAALPAEKKAEPAAVSASTSSNRLKRSLVVGLPAVQQEGRSRGGRAQSLPIPGAPVYEADGSVDSRGRSLPPQAPVITTSRATSTASIDAAQKVSPSDRSVTQLAAVEELFEGELSDAPGPSSSQRKRSRKQAQPIVPSFRSMRSTSTITPKQPTASQIAPSSQSMLTTSTVAPKRPRAESSSQLPTTKKARTGPKSGKTSKRIAKRALSKDDDGDSDEQAVVDISAVDDGGDGGQIGGDADIDDADVESEDPIDMEGQSGKSGKGKAVNRTKSDNLARNLKKAYDSGRNAIPTELDMLLPAYKPMGDSLRDDELYELNWLAPTPQKSQLRKSSGKRKTDSEPGMSNPAPTAPQTLPIRLWYLFAAPCMMFNDEVPGVGEVNLAEARYAYPYNVEVIRRLHRATCGLYVITQVAPGSDAPFSEKNQVSLLRCCACFSKDNHMLTERHLTARTRTSPHCTEYGGRQQERSHVWRLWTACYRKGFTPHRLSR